MKTISIIINQHKQNSKNLIGLLWYLNKFILSEHRELQIIKIIQKVIRIILFLGFESFESRNKNFKNLLEFRRIPKLALFLILYQQSKIETSSLMIGNIRFIYRRNTKRYFLLSFFDHHSCTIFDQLSHWLQNAD